ncbi:MAG: cytochrome c4 [Gammaproteobacteria bacterium]|nr:cytochrome c4 [Gammaproteobacteria bacterium]MBU1482371.1 cytochrome c4 [Gammaproteobacteria bacterium]
MKHKTNSNGLQVCTFIALICVLFMSAAHAETMQSNEAAASEVAAAPTPEAAASEVAATPEATAPEAPAVALSPFEERLQLCAGCHNPDGNSIIPENPRLAGLDKKYILIQLRDFKSGDRTNATMSAIIQMVDEKEFEDLAKYFSGQKRQISVSEKPELVEQGKQIFEEGVIGSAAPACMGCHGEDGSGDAKFPRLQGQNAQYVVNQLTNFKSGERANDAKGLMRAVAKRLNEQEMAAVAEYMSTLKEAE